MEPDLTSLREDVFQFLNRATCGDCLNSSLTLSFLQLVLHLEIQCSKDSRDLVSVETRQCLPKMVHLLAKCFLLRYASGFSLREDASKLCETSSHATGTDSSYRYPGVLVRYEILKNRLRTNRICQDFYAASLHLSLSCFSPSYFWRNTWPSLCARSLLSARR